MRIGSWNINWERVYQKNVIPKEIRNSIEKSNFEKSKIINKFIELKYDVMALLEAEDKLAPQIDGYEKFFCERKGKYGGILLYVNKNYKPQPCLPVIEEFKTNEVQCFLPLIVNNDGTTFHILFVWTTAKEMNEEWYGFERFRNMLDSKDLEFENTRNFLNGEKHNVIVIGDFNILYQKEFKKKDRKNKWEDFLRIMKNYSLKWKENYKNTFRECGANDHCFVSENLFKKTTFDVGEMSYNDVKSDHNLIYLTIDNKT